MLHPPPGDSAFWLLLVGLAAWRLTAFLVYERGPFEAGTRLRRALAAVRLGRVIACFHCTGFWIAMGLTLLLFGVSWKSAVLGVGLAGGVSIAERFLGGPSLAEGEA